MIETLPGEHQQSSWVGMQYRWGHTHAQADDLTSLAAVAGRLGEKGRGKKTAIDFTAAVIC
jgi:hypothetical protein